jgi:hypothetical protein
MVTANGGATGPAGKTALAAVVCTAGEVEII